VQAILTIVGGPHAGRKLWLRAGQAAEIGRGESMDLAVPRDAALAERHFVLENNRGACRLRDLAGRGTLVNGQPATEAMLRDGDHITAGQTVFALQIESDAAGVTTSGRATKGAGDSTLANAEKASIQFPSAGEVCPQFGLSTEARTLLEPELPADRFAERLVARQLYVDAVRCLAYALPRPQAIAWACQVAARSMGKQAVDGERAALDAATAWLREPGEEHRRAAFAAAQAAEFTTPAGLAALAVFWSGGSIAPPEIQEVPPAPHLCAQAVANSIILAAVRSEPQHASEKYKQFLQIGAAVARAEL